LNGSQALGKNEIALAEDNVQSADAKFSNGLFAPQHTQVIHKVVGLRPYEVLEQNVSDRRTVGLGKLKVNLLSQGAMVVYRPLAIDSGNE
jgi:hypothetical protein